MAPAQRPPLTLLEPLPAPVLEALRRLERRIDSLAAAVVAYSGGVDSSLVAAVAADRLGDRALAVTGVSPALAPHLRAEARQQARWLGLAQREVPTQELSDPAYASNPGDRCYACKRELHGLLSAIAASLADQPAAFPPQAGAGASGGDGVDHGQLLDQGQSVNHGLILDQGEPVDQGQTVVVLDGVNLDDLADHRPGLRAAREFGVLSPLADAGIDKAAVRQISRALGLPWWDKPAQPCLASRFPYGEPISAGRLQRVAAAEDWLRQRGFAELRVRSQGETARIELPATQLPEALARLAHGPLRNDLVETFQELGFTAVALDLEGLVSGKLNRALPQTSTTHAAEGQRQH